MKFSALEHVFSETFNFKTRNEISRLSYFSRKPFKLLYSRVLCILFSLLDLYPYKQYITNGFFSADNLISCCAFKANRDFFMLKCEMLANQNIFLANVEFNPIYKKKTKKSLKSSFIYFKVQNIFKCLIFRQ